MRLSAAKLGRQLAKENAEHTSGWSSDEFAEYFFDANGWKTVLRASWRQGSFAGIEQRGTSFLMTMPGGMALIDLSALPGRNCESTPLTTK